MTATERAMCTEAEDRAERYARLLWECHCAASDGIPVPFNRWLMDGGPDQMPADVRELRDAYDTVGDRAHRLELAIVTVAATEHFYGEDGRRAKTETALASDENCNDGGGTNAV
jgi:hypothetical protein